MPAMASPPRKPMATGPSAPDRHGTDRHFRKLAHPMLAPALPDEPEHSTGHHGQEPLPLLALGAIGVVFGDIGTSPLYALKESFAGHHPLAVDQPHIFGVLSLIFWTMMLIVTIKYVLIVLRADNHSEGGSLALLALIARRLGIFSLARTAPLTCAGRPISGAKACPTRSGCTPCRPFAAVGEHRLYQ